MPSVIPSKRFNKYNPIDGTLTGTFTPGLSGTEGNVNEGTLHILQTSRLELHHQTQSMSYSG